MKIYSIKEIVDATNNILKPEDKVYQNKKVKEIKPLVEKKKFQDTLILRNEIKTKKKNYIEPGNFNFKLKSEIKDNIINEIYVFLKKKIKKNTLKIIIEEQIEIKNLKNKIDFLIQSKNELINNYQALEKIKTQLLLENNQLEIENKELKVNLNQIEQDKNELVTKNHHLENDLKEKNTELTTINQQNRDLVINNAELKNTISRYINNTKKIQERLNTVEKSNRLDLEDKNIKIKFYQDENVRLSSELLLSQRKNENIKVNLSDIEQEKQNITTKIQELSKSIEEKTNVVSNAFKKINTNESNNSEQNISKNEIEKLNDKEQQSLDEVISRIFNKI